LETIGNNWKQLETKSILSLGLILFLFFDCKSQLIISTSIPGTWLRNTPASVCSPTPLTKQTIDNLIFATAPTQSGSNAVSPAGFLKFSSVGNANVPNNTSTFYRTPVAFATPQFPNACLITYNLTADNAFRLYVDGNSASTNILGNGGANSSNVCGTNYSGNNWNTAFYGNLTNDFNLTSPRNLVVETSNGSVASGSSPFWFSGALSVWRFADLNAPFTPTFSYNSATNVANIVINPGTTVNNVVLPFTGFQISFSIDIKDLAGNSWVNIYNSTPKLFVALKGSDKVMPPITLNCGLGSQVKITVTSIAGNCSVSTSQEWTPNPCFGSNAGDSKMVHISTTETSFSTDNAKDVTKEMIKTQFDATDPKLFADFRNALEYTNETQDTLFESKSFKNILVSPNPSFEGLIKIKSNEILAYNFRIVSTLGQIVYEDNYLDEQILDLGHLKSGLYFVQILNEKGEILQADKFLLNLR
jgi:hypothetical protein